MRAIALGVLCCGCITQRGFPCEQQSDCVLEGEHGWCEQPVGYCSYPDDACGSNRRFEPRAGDDLAGECVPGGDEGSGGESPDCLWQSVEAGELHACALDMEGTVYCWGSNQYGQLGNGLNSSFETVARQTNPPLTGVVTLATGASHMCALGSAGEVWCWGRNDAGQVSWPLRQTQPEVRSPLLVDVPIPPGALVAGGRRSCVVDGLDARCWGDISTQANEFFQLELPEPLLSAAAGDLHVCLVTTSGQVYCIGENSRSQLGLGKGMENATPNEFHQVAVEGLSALQVAAGRHHTCAIVTDPLGRLVECWGLNESGQAGDFPGGLVYAPKEVSGVVQDGTWTEVVAGPAHSCVLDEAGDIYCWGANGFGQSNPAVEGGDAVSDRLVLPGYESFRAIDIAAAGPVSCAIGVDHSWVCWGCFTPWVNLDLDFDEGGEGCTASVEVIECG